MLEDHLTEPVVPKARHERNRNTQPRQTERDVSRATARMSDEGPTSALADQVDKRLPDDNKHAHHPWTERGGAGTTRARRAGGENRIADGVSHTHAGYHARAYPSRPCP